MAGYFLDKPRTAAEKQYQVAIPFRYTNSAVAKFITLCPNLYCRQKWAVTNFVIFRVRMTTSGQTLGAVPPTSRTLLFGASLHIRTVQKVITLTCLYVLQNCHGRELVSTCMSYKKCLYCTKCSEGSFVCSAVPLLFALEVVPNSLASNHATSSPAVDLLQLTTSSCAASLRLVIYLMLH